MSTTPEFDESGSLQLINELAQILRFSEVNTTSWLCVWFADLSCLRQLIQHLRASPSIHAVLSERFEGEDRFLGSLWRRVRCSQMITLGC